jgi:hypothetical protein
MVSIAMRDQVSVISSQCDHPVNQLFCTPLCVACCEAVSLIQQIVMRELKVILEEAFSQAFDSLYERCKLVWKRVGTILSDGINKYFFCLFSVFFMASVQELDCHTVYTFQLKQLGHSVDKVEFIVMGGTFMCLPEDYRDYFIRNLHDALSGHTSHNVDEAVK